MSQRVSDQPPLLGPGEHPQTMEMLLERCVAAFPLSKTRVGIWQGFQALYTRLADAGITGELVVDGSFLTQEIDPDDVDMALIVSPGFYDGCSTAQREVIEWIRDDRTILETHKSDCYLCVEFREGHPEYFDGIQSRQYWVRLYSTSVSFKRQLGVAIVSLPPGGGGQ